MVNPLGGIQDLSGFRVKHGMTENAVALITYTKGWQIVSK